jgi:hypothetical protein
MMPDTVPEMDMTIAAGAAASTTVSEAETGSPIAPSCSVVRASEMPVATTSTTIGDDVPKEPKVVMGHSDLGAPELVSVPEAMDTALFALQQARDVMSQEPPYMSWSYL